MAEDDSDYQDILEGTVDEVKDKIRDLDDPDYEGLLNAEKDGNDRKTVKEFIQSRMDGSDEETTDENETEVVEEIEEETEGGVLGSFSRSSVMVAGVILGLVLGFAAASMTSTSSAGAKADPAMVQEDVKALAGAGDFNGTVDISEPEVRHSMYYFNVTLSQEQANKTVSQNQEVYVTLDGEKLFLVRKQFGQTLSPIDIETALQRAQQQPQQPAQPPQAPQQDTGETEGNSTTN